MFELVWILLSTLLVSLISLVGIFFITMKEQVFKKLLLLLVSFASGTLLGAAFLHLIPESLFPQLSSTYNENAVIAILVGILAFFLLEKSLWRHCHERDCPIHTFAYLDLLGDGVHNFIDGVVIAASFIVSIPLGTTTTLAVVAHEIPQEIGDFGILIYGGFSKTKALLYNFLTAIIAIFGATLMYFFSTSFPSLEYLLAFAAGGFIYIATSDLIPELHKETELSKSAAQFFLLLLGIALMWVLKNYLTILKT
jgi:zinc and cadmium transporter